MINNYISICKRKYTTTKHILFNNELTLVTCGFLVKEVDEVKLCKSLKQF